MQRTLEARFLVESGIAFSVFRLNYFRALTDTYIANIIE